MASRHVVFQANKKTLIEDIQNLYCAYKSNKGCAGCWKGVLVRFPMYVCTSENRETLPSQTPPLCHTPTGRRELLCSFTFTRFIRTWLLACKPPWYAEN